MRPIFFFFRPRQTPTSSLVVKKKKQQAKDVRLSLPFVEVMRIFRLTSLLPDMHRLSSPKTRPRRGRRHAHLSLLNLTLNLCILSSALSLVLLSPLLALLTSPTVPLPGSRLRSSPTTGDLAFLSPNLTPCIP